MKHKQHIAFFGSSLVSAYWNGAATYYRGIIKALYRKGYTITFYEPDAYQRQQHRDIPDPEWATVRVYPPSEKEVMEQLKHAAGADVIVKASGVGVFDELLEKEILELRNKSSNLVVFWDVDAPATLERVQKNQGDPFRALIPQYDFILTYGGGEPVVSSYEALGARKCIPVYNALDPETHHPEKLSSNFTCDLSFLGNRLPDREKRVEEFFINVAEQLPQKKFLLGGNGWHNKPLPENILRLGHVFTADHNKLNSSSRVVLNISRDSMASTGFSPATRVFEAAGAGACIITDKWKGIEMFFEPGKEILMAADGNEVKDILESLTPEKSKEIGSNALKRVLSEHTYAHRAEQLENIFSTSEHSVMA